MGSIKLGIIGPNWIEETMKKCLKMFPSFESIFLLSDEITDAPRFTTELRDQVDVILYSAYTPYFLSINDVPSEIPAHYIPLKGSSLYFALIKKLMNMPSVCRISVDSLDSETLLDFQHRVSNDIEFVEYKLSVSKDNVNKLVSFHRDLYQSGKTDLAITGLKLVDEYLKHESIPSEWALPTEEDFIIALERALLASKARQRIESQVVIGKIVIPSMFDEGSETSKRTYRSMYQEILQFVEIMEGFLVEENDSTFTFISTRGAFERNTHGYKHFPLIEDIYHKFYQEMNVGIGFGKTAFEAGNHAALALSQANEFEARKCFIVNERKEVIGPIERNPHINYPMVTTDQHLLEKAKNSGISPSYFLKINALLERRGTKYFSAQELAEIIGISTRSAHRILLKWLDVELVQIEGQEKPITKGRPRQVYSLKKE